MAASPPIVEVPELPVLLPEPEPAPAIESDPEPELQLAMPEVVFAERVLPPDLDRPYPTGRRAVFFDVENTSRAQHIARVIDHLRIDHRGHRTEFVAVGNWRVIGHDTARLLAHHGADLVHSAPSVGVRDWSDLRIAVSAGVWLAGARPGDVIEIVSDDRAFDAVGDVATRLGITFRRLSYRALAGAPVEEVPIPAPERSSDSRSGGDRRGHRYRGRFRGRHDGRPAPRPVVEVAPPAPEPVRELAPPPVQEVAPSAGEPHTAPHDEIIHVVRDLIRANPGRTVTIDAVANALKSRGFSRPPGSPRLITRLRRLKEIELNRAGMITLVDAAAPLEAARPVDAAPPVDAVQVAVPPVEEPPDPPPPAARVVAPPVDFDEEDEGPQPGNQKIDTTRPSTSDDAQRWRRRGGGGGRRWRGRGQPRTSAASN